MHFQFENPEYFLLLGLLPVLLLLHRSRLQWRRRMIARIGDAPVVERLFSGYSARRERIRFGILFFGFFLLILTLVNPQWGSKTHTVSFKSADILIAMDISESILCEDVSPNRLERAKSFAINTLKVLEGQKVGLIFFAGEAELQSPLTTDYDMLRDLISVAHPDEAPVKGTAIGTALRLAADVLGDSRNKKALILITDGETHDADTDAAAADVAGSGILILTAGVGTTGGGPVPTAYFGNEDFKRDENGKKVISAMNEPMLQQLAAISDGVYWNISGGQDFSGPLKQELAKLDSRKSTQQVFDQHESRFQFPLGIALVLFLIEFFGIFNTAKHAKRTV